MDNFKDVEAAAGRRLKDIAKAVGADAEQMARRQVAQHIVDLKAWTAAMGPTYYIAKGGILVPNDIRPTDDVDIQSARAYTETELMNGFATLRDLLRSHGVDLKSWRVREIDVGYGDPVTRVEWQATYGGIRANSHIDISSGFGRDAFPDPADVFLEDHPGMHPRLPRFQVRTQPIESRLAEKWLAVGLQSPTDFRMRHHADLILLHSQDVDMKKLGTELLRVMRHRGINPQQFTMGIHAHLKDLQIIRRSPKWDKVRAERANMRDFALADVWIEIARTYRGGVLNALSKAQLAETRAATANFRRLKSERRVQVTTTANVAAESSGDNVVQFRPRGM